MMRHKASSFVFSIQVHLSPGLNQNNEFSNEGLDPSVSLSITLFLRIPYLYFLFIVWGNNITVLTILYHFIYFTHPVSYIVLTNLEKHHLQLIFTKHSVTLTWPNAVFDTCISFTLFSRTLDPWVMKNGSNQDS